MAESISRELEQLERVGRVRAGGERQVHAGFGFSQLKRREDAQPVRDGQQDVADDLDDAFERLKARSVPE